MFNNSTLWGAEMDKSSNWGFVHSLYLPKDLISKNVATCLARIALPATKGFRQDTFETIYRRAQKGHFESTLRFYDSILLASNAIHS